MLLLLFATGLTHAVQLSEKGEALHPHGLESSVSFAGASTASCDGDTCATASTTATSAAAVTASLVQEDAQLAEHEHKGSVRCTSRADPRKAKTCRAHCASFDGGPCEKLSWSNVNQATCAGCQPETATEVPPKAPRRAPKRTPHATLAGGLVRAGQLPESLQATEPSQAARTPELHVLSYNLCFECMTRFLIPSGGKHAYMCAAEGDKETGQTSCARTMFTKITEWTMSYQFGVIALNELCHPGPGGNAWLETKEGAFGKFSDVAGKQAYCHIDNYARFLAPFEGLYYIFVASLDFEMGGNPLAITQMTLVRKDLFGGLPPQEVSERFDFAGLAVEQGNPEDRDRPLSVIKAGVEGEIVIMNVHGPHFRRQILGQGPNAKKFTFNGEEGGGNSKIPSISESLERLVPSGLTYSETGSVGGELGNAFSKHVVDTYVNAGGKNSDIFTEDNTQVKVIVCGDFNDETGELRQLTFNQPESDAPALPTVTASDTVYRTCCSDRDPYWLIPHDALGGKTIAERPSVEAILGVAGDVKSLEDLYLNQLGGYVGDNIDAAKEIPVLAKGVPRQVYIDVPYMQGMQPISEYPFASDLILYSGTILGYGPPMGYQQDLFSPMSDHDPVIATLSWP